MKVIIDIPQKIEEYIKDYIPIGAGNNVFCYPDEIVRMIQNGTPIPDNATNICGDICGDNRFEIIAKAKEDIISATNIEAAKDEMECLDSFLFRCWQMGWLDKYAPYQKGGKE